MRKFKIGDTVRCVENGVVIKPSALGYKPGKEFIVDFSRKSSDGEYIYFPKDDQGIYECDLILVKEDMENLIGKKVRGFKFESNYASNMDKHIGEIGEIIGVNLSKTTVRVKFTYGFWYYPTDQIEKHLVKELPKSFACRNTNQELWDKYIKWLNKEYYESFIGYSIACPYYGIDKNEVVNHSSKHGFDTILSLEEWDEIVNGTETKKEETKKEETKKEETMKKYEITREQLQKIYDVACSGWKETILKYSRRNPFGTTIEFTQEEVVAMFVASSLSQRTVLEGIFGKQIKELDFQSDNINFEVDGISVFGISNMKSDESFIGLPRANHPNSFFLNPDYVWTLDDEVLTVTRKNK